MILNCDGFFAICFACITVMSMMFTFEAFGTPETALDCIDAEAKTYQVQKDEDVCGNSDSAVDCWNHLEEEHRLAIRKCMD